MDLRRLRAGEWIAAVSGAALLVSLFLPWYGAGDENVTAWQSLAVLDVLLAFVAACGVLLLVVAASQRVPAVPIALSAVVALVGVVGLLLVLIRAASLPDGVDGRDWALWLGLAGALGVAAGGCIAMRDERLSPSGRHTDLTGRPAPPPPELEPIPAPRPE
jgi:peptidoglycan biosynthesis protein MviN/MurJ (putative lipid II flippase)